MTNDIYRICSKMQAVFVWFDVEISNELFLNENKINFKTCIHSTSLRSEKNVNWSSVTIIRDVK
jgi:hypothetical protein